MRSRTDVAGLSCAVVSGRGGGLTCAAAVVVLCWQPRRACRAAGVRGGAPRGGGWARRPTRNERERRQATGDRRPRPITVHAGHLRGRRAPPPDGLRGRRASQTSQNSRFATGKPATQAGTAQAGSSWASAQLRNNGNFAGCKFRRPPTSGGHRRRVQRAAGVYRCARAYRAGHKGTGRAVGRRGRAAGRQDPGLSVWVAPGGADPRTGRQQI